MGGQPLHPCTFFWISISGQNSIRGGGEGFAKRFGSLLKIWGVPKILEQFCWTFSHFRHFKSAGRKNIVQKPYTFSDANKIKCHAVLLHFAKCWDLLVKSAPRLPKIEVGGQFGQWPYLDCFPHLQNAFF